MTDPEHPRGSQNPTRLSEGDLAQETTRPEKPAGAGGAVESPRLGDFVLLRELGRGGMGVVYEARQLSLKRRVALKVLPPALGMSPQAKQRFEREAQAAAKLHHTNIVPVHAIGEHDGHHYYAMDLIEGQSLDRVLRDMMDEGSNPLMDATVTRAATEVRPQRTATSSPEQATTSLSDTSAGGREWFDTVAKLVADVADALHYAHGRGVIHRDIKPANLMLSREGHLSITDFGLARLLEEPGMTVSGSFLGTPAYMAPEQIAAGRISVDHRADVYSLGAVLYEMLTLQRPFGGQSREQVLAAVMSKDPRPPRRCNGKIPVDLETICLKALEKDADRRYATAGEMAQDLRLYLQGGLIAARRAGIARRTWKSIRRHPVAATVAVGVLIVVAASFVAWQWGGRSKEAQQLVSDARLALREGTYRDGLRFVDRAVALDPDSIEARLVRARLLIVNYRMREAADEARSVLQVEPQNHEAHAILAGLALDRRRQYRLVSIDPEPHRQVVEATAPESAEAYYLRALVAKGVKERIALLDRALDLDPDDQLALVARGAALEESKDFELEVMEANRLITARPKSAQGWRFKAWAYRGQRDFESARAAIERAMEIDGLDPWNYGAESWVLWDTGKHDEALAALTRAIELDPEHAFFYRDRAGKLNEIGRFEEAIADARGSIALNPDDGEAYGCLLRSYLLLDREDDVRATIDELRARADEWRDVQAKSSAYRTIADYGRQLKDYDLAMEAAERAIEIDPSDFSALIARMRIHTELRDDAAARADCDAAAQIRLFEPDSLVARGSQLHFACRDFDAAVRDFDRVIELAPKWYGGYLLRGTAYKGSQRFDEALADLDRAIELAPLFAAAYNNRANLFESLGRVEEALADRKRMLELRPYHAQSWGNYGVSLFDFGRLEEALAAEEKALELDPRRGHAHQWRARVLAWVGRCDEAASGFDRAAELNPAESEKILARAQLWDFYYNCPDRYDPSEALRHARSAYEANPTPILQGYLAHALFRNGDYTAARRIYAELYGSDPGATGLRGAGFEFAICLWHLGERAEARKVYDRSAAWMEERLPNSPELFKIRREAAELLGIDVPGLTRKRVISQFPS